MKKLFSAAGTRSGAYTLPARRRAISASGVRSISTTSSAAESTSSGIVSRTRAPVSCVDLVVEALEVLHVDRREHVDPGLEHLAHVLVALLVLDARRVGVRELVDQAQLRPAREHRRQVHLLQRPAAIGHGASRDHLEALCLRDRLRAAVRLEVADHDVAAVVGLGGALLEHAVGLAHARGHADEDLQASSLVGHSSIVAEATALSGSSMRRR